MVLRLSVIGVVSSFSSVFGWPARYSGSVGLPVEAVERRAEIVEHGGKVAVQCGPTAD
jgi:hypothetical protein